ncbi:MAG: PQQ-binding-like beta-propeller repeat protein [Phycisphaerae bacterium]
MDSVRIAGFTAGALIALALCAPASTAGPRQVDWMAAEPEPTIEWKESWDATYKFNVDKWKKDVAPMPRPEGPRRLAARTIRLLEALMAKYPADAAKRLDALNQIADTYFEIFQTQRACLTLQKIVDESPGRPEVATAALEKILRKLPWETFQRADHGEEWTEYASSRLIALNGAGLLSEASNAYVTALKARTVLRRWQGRTLEAWHTIASLDALSNYGSFCRTQQAGCLADVGRVEDAMALLRKQSSEGDDSAIDGRLADLLRLSSDTAAFPRNMRIEGRVDALAARPFAEQVEIVREILQQDAACRFDMAGGPSLMTSVWSWVDNMLLAQEGGPAKLAPLAAAQETDAAKAVAAIAGKADSAADRLAVFRRYPWAKASHEAMIEAGQDAIRRGQGALARRCFDDVLARSADAAVRDKAVMGLWMAMLLAPPGADAVNQTFRDVALNREFPWFGGRATALAIRQQLLDACRQAAAAPAGAKAVGPVAALARKSIELPAGPLWGYNPLVGQRSQMIAAGEDVAQLLVDGRDLFVAGPGTVYCYGDDLSRPRWTAVRRTPEGFLNRVYKDAEDRQYATVHGAYAPAVVGGKVFARWGYEPAGRYLDSIAAFDQATGRMLWSTGGDPAWQDIWPSSDPVFSEGRLYVLATQSAITQAVRESLVCIDAASGAMIWKRHLGSRDPSLAGSALEPVHFGNAVTVRDGAVYCSTGLGFAARCDARDGLLEWAALYSRSVIAGGSVQPIARRKGHAPIMHGANVIFMPRDEHGVFALDARTGKEVWDNPLVPSDELIGVTDGRMMLKDPNQLAALDCLSGKIIWSRRFADGIGPAAIRGTAILLATPGGLCQVACDSGKVIDQSPWATGPAASDASRPLEFALRDDQLLCITPQSMNQPGGVKPLNPSAVEPARFALPVKESWRIDRAYSRMLAPPPEAQMAGKLLLRSQNVLECLAATAKGGVEWRLVLDGGFDVGWAPKMVLAIYERRVVAIDAAGGAILWDTPVPFSIRRRLVCPPYLILSRLAGGQEQAGRNVGAIDLASGKLLWTSRFIRELGPPNESDQFTSLGYDGKNLHLIGPRFERNKPGELVFAPADGQLIDLRAFAPDEPPMNGTVAFNGPWGVYIGQRRSVVSLDLTGAKPPTPFAADLRNHLPGGRNYFMDNMCRMAGQWCALQYPGPRASYDEITTILKRDDPNYELTVQKYGSIIGDRFYYSHGTTLTAYDLPTRKPVTYSAQSDPADIGWPRDVIDWWEEDGAVIVLTGISRDARNYYNNPAHLRLDSYDAATGASINRQELTDVNFWAATALAYGRHAGGKYLYGTQAELVNNILFIVDDHGLHAYAPVPAGQKPVMETVKVGQRVAAPIVVDGMLDDWLDSEATSFKDASGGECKAYFAVGRTHFYMAVDYPAPNITPRRGRCEAGSGDVLEVSLQATAQVRLGVGLDDRGRTIVENWGTAPDNIMSEIECKLRYDADRGRMVCETAVPLKHVWVNASYMIVRNFAACFTAWDGAIGVGAKPRFTWRRVLTDVAPPPRR